jgi:predicted phosphodiesterase
MAIIFIADVHACPGDDLTLLIEFVQDKQADVRNVVILGGDIYEGFLFRPWYIPELKDCYWLRGNHEWFWNELLQGFYPGRVFDELWMAGTYLCHGNRFDNHQDSAVEIALAKAALEIYAEYPDDPTLAWIYNQIMDVHRTNTPIIKGLEKLRIQRACIGHSHVQCAMVDDDLTYFNPGSWRDKLAYVQIEENGEMHLEVF